MDTKSTTNQKTQNPVFKKYEKLLKFNQIRDYLSLSIGRTKRGLDDIKTLDQQLESICLSDYLHGVYQFFELYQAQKTEGFIINSPNELEKLLLELSNRTDNLIKRDLDHFILWIKGQVNEKNMVRSNNTVNGYYYQVRGLIHSIRPNIKFKNYNRVNGIANLYEEQKITFKILLDISRQLKYFISNRYMHLFISFISTCGLAYREIIELTLGKLRRLEYFKDNEYQYPLFRGERVKTNVKFVSFISKNLYENHLKFHLKNTENLPDEAKIFDCYNKKIIMLYSSFRGMFDRAYKKCITYCFPQYANYENNKSPIKRHHKIFTLHTFRHLFITSCNSININIINRDLMTAHKSPGLSNYNLTDDSKLLIDFKLVQEHLFYS